MRPTRLTLLVVLLLSGCGGGGSDDDAPPSGSTLTLVYRASTAQDPQVARDFPECVNLVGPTHVHLSWRNFERTLLTANGADEWNLTVSDVPVATDVRARISDANKCTASNTTGWSAENFFANGVALTPNTTLPDQDLTVPAYRFRVSAGGDVTQ